MNLLTFTQNNISARFLAGITIVSMLLSALPAAFFVANAADTLTGPTSVVVDNAVEFVTGSFDASAYNNLFLSFDFDASSLDATPVDSFTYGWRDNNGDNDIATLNGLSGNDPSEISNVATPLPMLAQVADLQIYVKVTSNTPSPADEVSITNLQVTGDAVVSTGSVRNVQDNLYFATIQGAIDAPTTANGETIELTADIVTTSQVRINKEITLDGNGYTVSPTFTKTTNDNNSVINVFAADNVTITDLVIDGSGGTNLHGINVYESDALLLSDLTITDNNAAVIVNSSEVTIQDITTSGNRWYAINVDKKTSQDALLTIKNTSVHGENSPTTPHIYIDDTTKAASVVDVDNQYDILDIGNQRVYTLKAEPIVKGAEYVVITGDTAAAENLPGWMFNRDVANATPIEFNEDESVIGDGALYVNPLSNTDGARKFIGEYFWQGAIADLDGFSYDFKIGSGGVDSDSEEFYLNVYANFGESGPTKYYDCKYDVVPSNGTTGSFATVTFDPTQSYPVTTRGGGSASPYTCPAVPADMNTLGAGGATIRAFAINTGDTTLTDADLDGYFDNVILNTKTKVTTFDFEKGAVDPNDENQLTITAIKFHNRNADNNRDTGEEALDGWEMRLYKEATPTDWTLVATGTTVAGQKKFPQQKDAGVYHICEVSQLGWSQVAPAEDTQTVNVSPNVAEEEPYCTSTTYSDESDRSTKPEIGNLSNDLNDQNQLNISGENYLDIAVDDCDNRTECLFSKTTTKLSGWEMRLYKEVAGIWTEIATSTTDNDGIYRFPTQYSAGVYHTCEVLEAGYAQGMGNWNGSGYLVNTANLSGAADEGPYCNTLTYTDIADRSSKSHFGNALITEFGDVTVCKYDEQGNSLAGWQLALLGQQVDTLAFAPTAAVQSMSSIPAGNYVLKADGAYKYRGGTNLMADARFSERKAGDAGFGTYPDQPWRITNPTNGGLAVSTNGDNGSLWGTTFSPSHVYYGSLTQNAVSDINFTMYDDAYSDNSGTIDLTLYQGFTGITEDNGCVVFEDVPYGNYEVAELMQAGFENTSGLGTQTVDEDEETFNVVNNDLSFVPPCEMEIVSDTGTLVVENNQFAVPTYVHQNWTDDITGATWVWETDRVVDTTIDQTLTFQETFTVTDVQTAMIEIAADNGYKLVVNGTPVVDRSGLNNFSDFAIQNYDIASLLVNGTNTFQVIVNNRGVSGSNDRSNPAGVLYKLEVTAGSNCVITTDVEDETVAPATLVITNPATPGMTLSGIYDFTAEYNDDDATEDLIQWAVRAGTCAASTGTMAGNVDGFSNSSTFAAPQFLATVDMSGWLNGEYCFVVNPLEQAGETNLRATQTFVLDNPVDEIDPETTTDTGTTTSTTTDPGTDTETDETPARRSGGSSSSGTRVTSRTLLSAPIGQVLGASTVNTCPFLTDFMQIGDNNDRLQVTYLQLFLNIFKDSYGGTANPITGVFGAITDANVKAFQEKYRSEVLDPWFERGIVPHDRPTGFVYKTTLWKINSIVCPDFAVYPSFAGEDLTTNVDNDINEPVQD